MKTIKIETTTSVSKEDSKIFDDDKADNHGSLIKYEMLQIATTKGASTMLKLKEYIKYVLGDCVYTLKGGNI